MSADYASNGDGAGAARAPGRDEFNGDGSVFESHCAKHGLCMLCGVTKVKKRAVFKLKKKNQWQSVTEKSKSDGSYLVYKGYCLSPGCFTLTQARRLLGEIGPSEEPDGTITSSFKLHDGSSSDRASNRSGHAAGTTDHTSGSSSGTKKGISRLLRGRGRSSDGGSSGRKGSGNSKVGLNGDFTGFSSVTSKSSGDTPLTSSRSSRTGRKSTSSSGTSVTSVIRRDDDDMSVGSTMTSESKVRSSLKQLLKDNMGTILDLSSTRLHHVHISELVNSLSVATSLQTLILENCKLNDNEVEILANGLASTNNKASTLSRMSFRSNRIGNRGAVSLRPFLTKTDSLEELDLSKNQIGSRGANYVLHAFRDNPQTKIKMINLAHNEIWDTDGDGSFFAKNSTLQLLNVEGNFIHDEGIQSMANGLRNNASQTQLSELYLGWNGIGDQGCIEIARMLETNKSLRKLGIGENDISSIGARALLSALSSNRTLRRITGLSHNAVDRTFIIASIKLLLNSYVEAITTEEEAQKRFEEMMESSLHGDNVLAEPVGTHLPTPEEMSESSMDWADRLFAPGEDAKAPIAEIKVGVPLGEIAFSPPEASPEAETNNVPNNVEVEGEKGDNGVSTMPAPAFTFDRVTMMQAAPLAYLHPSSNLRHPIRLRDFDCERQVIEHAFESAKKIDATIELDVQIASVENFRSFFETNDSRVLHFSSFGLSSPSLPLENSEGMLDDSIDFGSLSGIVRAAPVPIELVVVNSFYSGRIGKAFLDAGVPHVICCHHTEIFRDKASHSFLKNLYRGLALNKSIKRAFLDAREAVRVEEITKHVERYVLLPRKPDDDSFHDVPLFYTKPTKNNSMLTPDEDSPDRNRRNLPHIPRYFIGRELDICEILEAVKLNDDVIRVGGPKGSGKTSVVAATCRYIESRKDSLGFDNVFWLPPPKGAVPEPDTLFGDLSELVRAIIEGGDDISNIESAMECKERIELELEGQRTLLAIDNRKFKGTIASDNLEHFLGGLLESDLDVKIFLVSQADGDTNEDDEDDTVVLGPLDFKSTALLFGEVSRFITPNGCPAAQSPDEFSSLMVPPSVALLQEEAKGSSSRQRRIMSQIGNGLPADVIRAGKSMPASVFIHLIGMANTPEVRVDSYSSLKTATEKWSSQLERSVRNKCYLRAMDLDHVMRELQDMKRQFPSLDDLIAKEQELHRRHTSCFKNRQYEEGNRLKREILGLKKQILQEKRSATLSTRKPAADDERLSNLQEQVDSIMKLANSSFSSETDLPAPDRTSASFVIGSAYHNCDLQIYSGNVCEFDPNNNDLGAVVCWTNECCDLNLDEKGKNLLQYGGSALAKDVGSLPGITKTPWGVAKCGTGNAVIVGPGNYSMLSVCCVILAVGPLSAACTDVEEADTDDSLHYIEAMLRSCIRSGLILAKHSQVQSVAFPTLTSSPDSQSYDRTLLMLLKILVEEAKHSDLITLHLVASSDDEASKLIGLASTLFSDDE